MRRRLAGLAVIAGTLLIAGPATAQQVFVYPTKGQSQAQQDQDRSDCHAWAVQQTGFDPANPHVATGAPPPSQPATASPLRGAARGAAVGAIGGAIAGDAGKGAAIGAATGGLIGGMRRRDQRQQQDYQQQQYHQQQQAALSQGQANYNRAFAACMQARGYTVN